MVTNIERCPICERDLIGEEAWVHLMAEANGLNLFEASARTLKLLEQQRPVLGPGTWSGARLLRPVDLPWQNNTEFRLVLILHPATSSCIVF